MEDKGSERERGSREHEEWRKGKRKGMKKGRGNVVKGNRMNGGTEGKVEVVRERGKG